jgi:hypothetical protein
MTQRTVDSLVVGEQVQVTGAAGSDGTVTAAAIRVGGGAAFGGGGVGGTTSSSSGA